MAKKSKPKMQPERADILHAHEDALGITNLQSIERLIELNKFDAAEKEINKLLRKNPKSFEGMLLEGKVCERKGMLGSAIQAFETAIRTDPLNPLGHYLLGALLADGIDQKKGIAHLKKTVSLAPENAGYKAQLAQSLFLSGQKKQAQKLIQEAVSQDSSNGGVVAVYHLIFKSDSAAITQDIVKLNPTDHFSLNMLGVQYLEEGKYEEACETFARALKLEPGSSLLQQNYKIALKARLPFYRPRYHLTRIGDKHGIAVFYLVWYGAVFAIIAIGLLTKILILPAVLLVITAWIYSWVADPIAEVMIRKELK